MTDLSTLPWKGLAAPAIMLFVVGLAFSLSMPLLALALDHAGVSAALVGVTATGGGIGILVAGLVSPRLLERYGLAAAAGTGIVLSAAIFLILPWHVDVWLWLVLRFVLGFASAMAFIAGEAWMVQLAPDRVRGRVLAAYGGLLAASFAIGPALIPWLGSRGPIPILVTAGLVLIALLPLMAGRRHAPALGTKPARPMLGILLAVPEAAGAILLFGALETASYTALPLYGLRSGLDDDQCAVMIAAIGLGGAFLIFPMGWAADRVSRRRLLVLATLIGGCGYALLPAAVGDAFGRFALMFVIGGVAACLYPVALALLGERFSGNDLAAANAGAVFLYAIGTLAAPPLFGQAMDSFGPVGFPAGVVLASTLFVLWLGFAMQRRRRPT